MFNKDNNSHDIKEAETIIGPSIKVKGNFHGEGNIIIEGTVEGSVKTNNFLLVSEKATVIANVNAKNSKIGGKISGNIKIDGYLEIASTARIDGDIFALDISVEKGAKINGKINMEKGAVKEVEEKEKAK